jgi:hypothetical protein
MGRHPLNRLSLSPHTPHDLAEGDASPSTGESKKRKTQKLHGRLARLRNVSGDTWDFTNVFRYLLTSGVRVWSLWWCPVGFADPRRAGKRKRERASGRQAGALLGSFASWHSLIGRYHRWRVETLVCRWAVYYYCSLSSCSRAPGDGVSVRICCLQSCNAKGQSARR